LSQQAFCLPRKSADPGTLFTEALIDEEIDCRLGSVHIGLKYRPGTLAASADLVQSFCGDIAVISDYLREVPGTEPPWNVMQKPDVFASKEYGHLSLHLLSMLYVSKTVVAKGEAIFRKK
jgi:hypothetical protein